MTPSPADDPSRDDRDAAFTTTALPHLSTIARVATALTGDAADTEDLVQETFLRAYRHWHTFQPGSDCKSWLATICRHTFAELRRRENRSVAVDDQELESLAAARVHTTARAKGVDDMFARLDLGPAIARAIRELEPHYRDVVLLVDVDGFSYEEVAASLDIPVGTVRSRLYRARRHLQEALLNFAIDAGYASPSYTLPPNHPGERRNA
ncbi:MAG TPA: RNA polymerase sigma factor [Gemmatimonadaceae bacterium]